MDNKKNIDAEFEDKIKKIDNVELALKIRACIVKLNKIIDCYGNVNWDFEKSIKDIIEKIITIITRNSIDSSRNALSCLNDTLDLVLGNKVDDNVESFLIVIDRKISLEIELIELKEKRQNLDGLFKISCSAGDTTKISELKIQLDNNLRDICALEQLILNCYEKIKEINNNYKKDEIASNRTFSVEEDSYVKSNLNSLNNHSWNNNYGSWIDAGWNNNYGSWIDNGWNNNYSSWSDAGWNNNYGSWVDSGWENVSYSWCDGSWNNDDIPPRGSKFSEIFGHSELKKENQEIGEVNFSVITPHTVCPGEVNELYFVLYESHFEKLVNKIIEEVDYDPNVYYEKLSLEKGTYRIVMTNSIDNYKEEETINWKGKYKKCSFLLDVPEDYDSGNITVYFDLYNDRNIRLLNFECSIIIASNKEPILIKHKVKRVFLSYSRKDLKEVLRIRQGMEALGNGQNIFLDIIDLKENSDWEYEIKNQINNSDVFFLIWSGNSSAKRNDGEMTGVEKEYEYALERIKNNKELSLIVINIDGIDVPPRIKDVQKCAIENKKLRAFISYSKEKESDKNEIDYILLGMKALCKANEIDLRVLNYKTTSNNVNLKEIDSSDIFYLMLSKSSTNDGNVENEYKYAIEKYGNDFVFAIPLEKAENIKIPKLLEKKHLNSTIVYIIDGLKKDLL